MKVFVGITGASGVIYGVKVLELLRRAGVEIHLSVSKTAEKVIKLETDYDVQYVKSLADYIWDEGDLSAPPASGSFGIDAVAVVPCSTKTLAAIANGFTVNLIVRAAEVGLKERRRVVLVVRESPLSLVHIRNMELATMAGAVVMPAAPGFYTRPKTIDDLVTTFAGRVLDLLGVKHNFTPRWGAR
ncbi:polyprenyl P-hydroxybenzoate and phenylacrylic acid decarboxylase [Pyrobaculum sp. WP30]|jgi:4-hydroxy-3-polyprenylbenzoate decarboxylase|nr:polyprenyl P-hydroxybenzoate and phenylacrylic acid decarboxylase [Pyrobaculum sp. WP30]KUO89498.1 MAG: aromatic acid decarboxylase [Pyrobaculum sp. OCT_11]MDT7874378.1 UbiX family flavin prenyltransferase [Pyrobaculum sp.]